MACSGLNLFYLAITTSNVFLFIYLFIFLSIGTNKHCTSFFLSTLSSRPTLYCYCCRPTDWVDG